MNFVRFENHIAEGEPKYHTFDFRGSYAPILLYQEMRDKPAHNLANDRLIIDIGANVGMWAIRYALLYPECHFICYEPYSVNARHLRMGIEINGLKNVELVDKAVTHDGRDITVIMNPVNSAGASALNFHESDMFPRERVKAVSLNAVCENHASIDALKVDIEGGEYLLFEGFRHWDKLKKVFIQVNPRYAGITDQEKEFSTKTLLDTLRSKLGHENVFISCAEEKFRGL